MNKILMFCMGMMAVTSVYAADEIKLGNNEEGPQCESMHHRPDFAALKLSDEQKQKMEAMMEKHHKEMHTLHEKHKADMKALLTPEQFSQFEAMKPKHMGMKEMHHGKDK